MRRISALFLAVLTFLIVLAPPAFADSLTGEGLYGEADDKVVTAAGFILIAFFPLLIVVLNFIYARLEKRRYARLDAQKARKARADQRGGW